MEVRLLPDPMMFSESAQPYLTLDPVSTNVIGVQLDAVITGMRAAGPADIWIVVSERGTVIGVGMHTPPHSMFLPRLRAGCASEIAAALHAANREISGVTGEARTVAEFLESWRRSTGSGATLVRGMRMYRLGRLQPPTGVGGKARPARGSDVDLIVEWLEAFGAETAQEEGFDPHRAAHERLASGGLWLWIDGGQPVALAAHSQPAAGVARVGPVYTPPDKRGSGYGSAVTAAATQSALSKAAMQVILYTDLANPTSNAIYQELGYVADHDAQHWEVRS